MKKLPQLTCSVVLDYMGCGDKTPEEEFAAMTKRISKTIANPVRFVNAKAVHGIANKTDLVLFDFGGIMPGSNLMQDQSREVIRWAEDHPSALVLVVSDFTFTHAVEPEMAELGLSKLPNIKLWDFGEDFPFWPGITLRNAEPGELLPAIQFFKPREEFFERLDKHYPGEKFIDVGAGCGQLTRALTDHGRFCLGVDLYERDNMDTEVALIDATMLDYPAGVVPILARPCHGSFISQVVTQAMKTVDTILYIGLAENLSTDLAEFVDEYDVKIATFDVGEEDELVVKIAKKL